MNKLKRGEQIKDWSSIGVSTDLGPHKRASDPTASTRNRVVRRSDSCQGSAEKGLGETKTKIEKDEGYISIPLLDISSLLT